MAFPVTITFRDIHQSDFVEQHVQRKADKLAQSFPRILACDVAIEEPHKHHQHGNHFRVRIRVSMPGGPVVVDRSSSLDARAEDLHATVECAFDDLERVLHEQIDRRRTKRLHESNQR